MNVTNKTEINEEFTFETERVFGRPWRMDDAEGAYAIYGNRQVYGNEPNLLIEGIEQMRTKLAKVIERDSQFPAGLGSYASFHKPSGKLAGNLLLKALPDNDGNLTDDIEIGWHLERSFWGQGLASEGARELLRIGFETVGLDEVLAVCRTDNEKSMAVMRRIGMTHVGQTEQYYPQLVELWKITRDEFENTRNNQQD